MLRKQYEAMSQELKEATQETEVAKCRRDWAFQERDKIVAERESIRCVRCHLRVVMNANQRFDGHPFLHPQDAVRQPASGARPGSQRSRRRAAKSG